MPNILVAATDGSLKEVSVKYQRQTYTHTDEKDNQLFTLDFDKQGLHFATAGKDT